MQRCSYQLTFTTPAFLGNAEQQAQWRTPPIKALLRQWWRVTVAQDIAYDVARLRKCEAELFGTAADNGDSHQSRIRVRLSGWEMGQLKEWPRGGTVSHPEVRNPVGSDLYLGFGPLEYNKATRNTALKTGAAIQAGASATLQLAFPEEHAAKITQALWLMDRYGTLGGRSRNGWGSLSLASADAQTATPPSRDWRQSLQLDWPHALGSDQHGLLAWQTQPFDNWPKLMQELARLKIGLRTQFNFTSGRDAPHAEARHWLSYPVTNHSVSTWDKNARLPNSLRFKVRPAPNDPGKLVGVVFHMPCLPPSDIRREAQKSMDFTHDLTAITAVWQTVHAFLDAPAQPLTRIPA